MDETTDENGVASAPITQIPTLSDILGADSSPAQSSPDGDRITDGAADALPESPRKRGRPSNADVIASLRAELAELRQQVAAQVPAQPAVPNADLAAALAALVANSGAGGEPKQPAEVDPMAALSPEVVQEYGEFLNKGLAPVIRAVESKFAAKTAAEVNALRTALEQQKNVIEELRRTTSAVGDVRSAAVRAGVVAANPDFAEIETSPEWEEFLSEPVPMLSGVTYGGLLQHAATKRDVGAAVKAYADALRIYRERTNRGGSTGASLPTRPTAVGVSAPTRSHLNIAAEIEKTQAAIDQLESKPVKTERDLDTLSKLFDRMKALELSASASAGAM
jgi:hypothetical protein